MYLEETIEDVVEVTENEEVIKQEPILSEEDANLSARRRTHSSTRRRRHRERDRVSNEDGDNEGGSAGKSESSPIENLDFVGELNGSGYSERSTSNDNNNNNNNNNNTTDSNSIAVTSSGVSFGENEVRTFETDASERKNEYASHDDDADDDDDDSGRIKIGGDIKLDTLDIHTLNDMQSINAPPLLDDIEVLA
jgi:hypothetical protein